VSLYWDQTGKEWTVFTRMMVANNAFAKSIKDFLERHGCGIKTKEGQELIEVIHSDRWALGKGNYG